MATSKPPSATGNCPICSKPTELRYRPFCSRRCADVDLSRWLSGTYAIPDKAEPEDDPEAPAAAPDDEPERKH